MYTYIDYDSHKFFCSYAIFLVSVLWKAYLFFLITIFSKRPFIHVQMNIIFKRFMMEGKTVWKYALNLKLFLLIKPTMKTLVSIPIDRRFIFEKWKIHSETILLSTTVLKERNYLVSTNCRNNRIEINWGFDSKVVMQRIGNRRMFFILLQRKNNNPIR